MLGIDFAVKLGFVLQFLEKFFLKKLVRTSLNRCQKTHIAIFSSLKANL